MEYRAVHKPKPDDTLEHRQHKYITKKFVNGKWRYYYKMPTKQSDYHIGTDTKYVRVDLSRDYGDDQDYNVMRNRKNKGDSGIERYDQDTYLTYGRKEVAELAKAKTAQAIEAGKAAVNNILNKFKKR